TIDARNRADAGASIVRPAYATPGLGGGTVATVAILDIASSDVRVDGFVFDGDNLLLNSAVTMGSANPDVDSGVFAFGAN
ncbi:hypothetical protein ABTK35_20390, partial [Acinetobacter baumannii]